MLQMRNLVALTILCFAITCASAEPRWCSITGLGTQNTLHYPPIARAARVSGVVIGRLQYQHNGTVTGFVAVSGPLLLVKSASQQLMQWTVQTSARGNENCETLLVASFQLDDHDDAATTVITRDTGMIRVAVNSYQLVISDPAFYLGKRHWWHGLFHRLR